MRVLPYWPATRYLELAPKYWATTRSNLDPVELDTWLCPFTVPPAALNFARYPHGGFRQLAEARRVELSPLHRRLYCGVCG
jgi:hypothetical protein